MSNEGQACKAETVTTSMRLRAKLRRLRIPLYSLPFYGPIYRLTMKLAHRFNWHYMQPIGPLEDGARQIWCHWCGARYTIPKRVKP